MTETRDEAIEALIQQFLSEVLADPDIAAKSDDFKAGYAQAFREAIVAFAKRDLQKKEETR